MQITTTTPWIAPRRGGGTQQSSIQGGSTLRSNPLPSYEIPFWQKRYSFRLGVWKSRKPESGIGTGNGNGTGTVMWRGTNTRTGTSFTLNYFNSNSIYTKNKKTSLVSCPPPPESLYIYGNEKVEKAASNSFASASRFLSISSPSMHNYEVNDQILSSLENVNGRR